MIQSTLTDAMARARSEWLAGDREAWSRYAACVAQMRALQRAETARPVPMPLPSRDARPDRAPTRGL